jgi:hypothetical protein
MNLLGEVMYNWLNSRTFEISPWSSRLATITMSANAVQYPPYDSRRLEQTELMIFEVQDTQGCWRSDRQLEGCKASLCGIFLPNESYESFAINFSVRGLMVMTGFEKLAH